MAAGRLDFLVIGAARCGTTTLYEHLRRHPEVFMPVGKEVPFFSHDRRHAEGWDRFEGLHFPAGDTEDKVVGKASPQYMAGSAFGRETTERPTYPDAAVQIVPRRIAEAFPDAKLIAILRDPVDRAISHQRLAAMVGWDGRPVDRALTEDLGEERLAAARLRPDEGNSAVVFGEYSRILSGYLKWFPRDQLLVTGFDQLRKDEAAFVRRAYGFLGIDPDYVPDSLGQTFNQGAGGQRLKALDFARFEERAAGSAALRQVWGRLPDATRTGIRRRYRGLAYRAFLWNRRSATPAESPSPAVRDALARHFEPWNESLLQMFDDVPDLAGTVAVDDAC
jgi:hypothetical protein